MTPSSQQLLQSTLNLIPAHTWYAGPEGDLRFVNKRCADYLGLAEDDLLRSGLTTGRAWDSHVLLLHPEDAEMSRKVWKECLSARLPSEVRFRVRNAQGGYRWFQSRVEPSFAQDGTLERWIGINLDVDDSERAKFYLAEGERLGHTGSWAYGDSGFRHWSSGLYELHGLPASTHAPTNSEYLQLVHPEDRESVAGDIARMLAARSALDFTKRIIRPDGETRFVRCVGVPASSGGPAEGFVGTAIDVTGQEELTRALRKSEEEARQLVELTPHMVGVMGPKGEKLYINETALSYYGICLDEWVHSPWGAQVHPDDHPRLREFEDHLSSASLNEVEIRLQRKDGAWRWFLARYSPVCDEKGQPLRWYIAVTDIEERKAAEERLRHENVALREEIDKTSMFEEVVGASPALTAVLARVAKVAGSDSTVLIAGETGTGKELIARAIHRHSLRSTRPFIAVNCAALPRELIATELFGHEKGAFTGATQRRLGRFELADGGTIFLDEVGELLPDTQVSLLRVLQEREVERVGGRELIRVDVRVIAATNGDLERAVAEGAFRQDLFYRLNVFPVQMPALRERRDDIALLVEYFINRYARKLGKSFRHVHKETLERLKTYPWPGNVRELQNVIERSVIVCDSEEFAIDESWLSSSTLARSPVVLPSRLAAHEKTIIEEALRDSGGRVFGPSGAAMRLGIPRSTLESKIRALRINKARFRQ